MADNSSLTLFSYDKNFRKSVNCGSGSKLSGVILVSFLDLSIAHLFKQKGIFSTRILFMVSALLKMLSLFAFFALR